MRERNHNTRRLNTKTPRASPLRPHLIWPDSNTWIAAWKASKRNLYELEQVSESLNINILKHFYAKFKPRDSKNLASAIKTFHARGDMESADYRSAYHQLCDWFYGWDVSNNTIGGGSGYADAASAQGGGGADPDEDAGLRRVPRDIKMGEPSERAECERIMRTFETLFALSRRMLKRFYLQIEEMTPRIGQGLGTISNQKDNQDDFGEARKEDVWKHESHGAGGGASAAVSRRGTTLAGRDGLGENGEVEDEFVGSFDNVHLKREADGMIVRKGDATAGGAADSKPDDSAPTAVAAPEGDDGSSRASSPDSDKPAASATATPQPINGTVERGITPIQRDSQAAFNHSVATPSTRRGLLQDGPTEQDIALTLQKDVSLVYTAVNKSLDYALVCASNILLVLAFAELLDMKDVFQKFNSFAHELSHEFVSNSLKTVWDLLHRELTNVGLHELRDPTQLRVRLREVAELGKLSASAAAAAAAMGGPRNGPVATPTVGNPRARLRTMHRKFELLHEILSWGVDIHLFPNFVAAHRDGAKSAQFSAFDSNLWLSGGYDGVIRIHDLRASSAHICLSQYVGHKSIVTEVHFTKDDTHIVSCSFDRTVKIWNSQSASCEKTLVGHTDSVMSCDVTVDKRYIVSGSADNTARLWDFATGECIAVMRKHTRWVKLARFSPDARFIATAGLDNKIHVWDVKFVANSRNFAPKRTIENHRDYILDLALTRPAHLLTASRDMTVRLFDYVTGAEVYAVSLAPSWACAVAFSASGEFFATGSFDNNVGIYAVKDGRVVRQIRVLNLGIMCVRWAKDLSYVVVGTQEGFLQQIPL
ncbi:hypothetical protein HDU83_001133 [Entophlyctis luteolus]|nr:hypothetical protein HDU83_001133 [Entophlyctis luteolus]